ncbi:MAG: hypothetical protein HZB50_03910 [Chloroflexi bacterium]|nr:hypothetical protein [Chloroflexota bacterium]
MKFNYQILVGLVITCSLVATSCQATPTGAVVEITRTAPAETAVTTPIPSSTASAGPQIPILIKTFEVSPTQSFFSWWSNDSSKLYYERNGSWEFDLVNGVTSESHVPRPETPQCEYLPDISNGIWLIQQDCSPSRKKIIYYTIQANSPQTPSPIPPPPDCNEGICPVPIEGSLIDIWVSENGESQKVGELINCIKDFIWADDEQRLVAVGFDDHYHLAPPICNDLYYAWLIDLSKNQITPLLSKVNHRGDVLVYDYSPDGKFLLYAESQRLYLLDVQTQDTVDLQVSREFDNAWWINENKILISFYLQTGGYNMGWGILDLGSVEYTELLNESNTIGEYILGNPILSPDEKWMAFTASDPNKDLFGFWLLNLATP